MSTAQDFRFAVLIRDWVGVALAQFESGDSRDIAQSPSSHERLGAALLLEVLDWSARGTSVGYFPERSPQRLLDYLEDWPFWGRIGDSPGPVSPARNALRSADEFVSAYNVAFMDLSSERLEFLRLTNFASEDEWEVAIDAVKSFAPEVSSVGAVDLEALDASAGWLLLGGQSGISAVGAPSDWRTTLAGSERSQFRERFADEIRSGLIQRLDAYWQSMSDAADEVNDIASEASTFTTSDAFGYGSEGGARLRSEDDTFEGDFHVDLDLELMVLTEAEHATRSSIEEGPPEGYRVENDDLRAELFPQPAGWLVRLTSFGAEGEYEVLVTYASGAHGSVGLILLEDEGAEAELTVESVADRPRRLQVRRRR